MPVNHEGFSLGERASRECKRESISLKDFIEILHLSLSKKKAV